jgi:hypothetical protein
MAIKIEIPGLDGPVTVEGAAEESTMKSILDAVNRSDKTKQTEEKKLAKAKEEEIKKSKKLGSELDQLAEQADGTGDSLDAAGESADKFSQGLKQAVTSLSSNIYSFGKDLSLTAASVSANWATSYDDLAKNPIKASSELINTSLELLQAGLEKTIDTTKGIAGGLLGMIPVIGDGAARLADTAGKVSKGVLEASVTILQASNKVFAAELQKRTEALSAFTKAGASFAGGMTEMSTIANESGLGIADFSRVVGNSREDIRGMGLSASEGSLLLSKGLKGMASGTNSVRNQLLALGYGYEEQGEILAQYAAQRQSEGRLRGMSEAQLAKGTQEYATNLKVLSDITGKDAKAAMEKARDESMRSSLMASLSGDQLEAFKLAYSQLETLGPEYQRALVQKMVGGAVAIPGIVANKQAMQIIDSISGAVKSGSKNITSETQNFIAENAKQYRAAREGYGQAVDLAAVYGVQGAEQFAAIGNALEKYLLDPGAAEASAKRAESQQTASDELTTGFQAATEETKKFQVAMETLTGTYMKDYANIVKATVETTSKMLRGAAEFAKTGDLSAFQKTMGLESGTTETDTKPKNILGKNTNERGEVKAGRGAVVGHDFPSVEEAAKQGYEPVYVTAGRAGRRIVDWKPATAVPAETKGYAKGGNIKPGQIGITGEQGPELVVGPSSIVPNNITEQLIGIIDSQATLKDKMSSITSPAQSLEQLVTSLTKTTDRMESRNDTQIIPSSAPPSEEMPKMNGILQEQTQLLRSLLDAMSTNNRMTSGILQNSL